MRSSIKAGIHLRDVASDPSRSCATRQCCLGRADLVARRVVPGKQDNPPLGRILAVNERLPSFTSAFSPFRNRRDHTLQLISLLDCHRTKICVYRSRPGWVHSRMDPLFGPEFALLWTLPAGPHSRLHLCVRCRPLFP